MGGKEINSHDKRGEEIFGLEGDGMGFGGFLTGQK